MSGARLQALPRGVAPDVQLDRHVVLHPLHAGDVPRCVGGLGGHFLRVDEPGELHDAAEGLDVDLARGHPALVDERGPDAVREPRVLEGLAGGPAGARVRAGGEREECREDDGETWHAFLQYRMVRSCDVTPWTFGAAALMRSLAKRGVL